MNLVVFSVHEVECFSNLTMVLRACRNPVESCSSFLCTGKPRSWILVSVKDYISSSSNSTHQQVGQAARLTAMSLALNHISMLFSIFSNMYFYIEVSCFHVCLCTLCVHGGQVVTEARRMHHSLLRTGDAGGCNPYMDFRNPR